MRVNLYIELDVPSRTCELIFEDTGNESFIWNILQMKTVHYKLIKLSGLLVSKFF